MLDDTQPWQQTETSLITKIHKTQIVYQVRLWPGYACGACRPGVCVLVRLAGCSVHSVANNCGAGCVAALQDNASPSSLMALTLETKVVQKVKCWFSDYSG